MTNTEVVSLDAAEAEFNRFVEKWDIDADVESMSAEDKDSFDAPKRRIIRAIQSGRASVDDEGRIEYRPIGDTSVDSVTFSIPSGQAYMGMDRYKDRQNMHKMFGFMGSMTKQDAKVFAKMDGRDAKFCMGIAQLFLGS